MISTTGLILASLSWTNIFERTLIPITLRRLSFKHHTIDENKTRSLY